MRSLSGRPTGPLWSATNSRYPAASYASPRTCSRPPRSVATSPRGVIRAIAGPPAGQQIAVRQHRQQVDRRHAGQPRHRVARLPSALLVAAARALAAAAALALATAAAPPALLALAVALARVVRAVLARSAADPALVPLVPVLHVRLHPVRRARDPRVDLLGQFVRLVPGRDRHDHPLGLVLPHRAGPLGHVHRAQPLGSAVRPLLIVQRSGRRPRL